MKHTPPPTKTPRQIWFPAKRYGWGWGPPVCWQGWLVTAAYVAAMAGGAVWLGGPKRAPIFVAYALTLSFLLVGVCWWKGETPRWSWGDRPRDPDAK